MASSNMGLAIFVTRSSSRVADELDVHLHEHNVGDAEGKPHALVITRIPRHPETDYESIEHCARS